MTQTLILAMHGLPVPDQALGLREDLPAAEWQWIERLRQPQDRLRSLVGRAMARRLLGAHLGQAAAAVRLTSTQHGKPVLDTPSGQPPGWHFNIAHSGDEVLVAVGPQPLGIDVEVCPRTIEPGLLRLVMGADRDLEGLDLPQAFCAEWVCREAILKACGLGLTIEPGGLHFTDEQNGWRLAGGVPSEESLWVRVLWQTPSHCAGLCLAQPPSADGADAAAPASDSWHLMRLSLAQSMAMF